MKRLLPYVQENSYDHLNDELNETSEVEYYNYLEDILFDMKDNNKEIVNYLYSVLPDSYDNNSQLDVIETGLLVYHLLDLEAMSENIMLPKVSKATVNSVNRDFSRGGINYMKEKVSKVKKTNPLIYWYYLRFPTNSEDMDNDTYNGFIVYNLLERQAEAELMKKNFNIGKAF
jgi:hypothetical protein